MLKNKKIIHNESLFLINDLVDIVSAPSSDLLNLGNKVLFKWTDSEDFVQNFQKNLKHNDQASQIHHEAFNRFLQKKKIPIWIKQENKVVQYSYFELLEKHLIYGQKDDFDLLDCEFSYYSEHGPFVRNSMLLIIGQKNIEHLVRYFLLENKIHLRQFRLQTQGVCGFTFDDVFMLHGLQINSIDKQGMNATLPQNYQSYFKQFEKFHFYMDTSLFSITSELNIEQAARHFSFYERDIFTTRDPAFMNTFKTADIVIRKHTLDANKIMLYIPFAKNLTGSNLQLVVSKFIDQLKSQLFDHFKI
jgi:hypothetical protein